MIATGRWSWTLLAAFMCLHTAPASALVRQTLHSFGP